MRNFEIAEIVKDTGKIESVEIIDTVESLENADRMENTKKIDIPQERILESLIALWADMYGIRVEQVERM